MYRKHAFVLALTLVLVLTGQGRSTAAPAAQVDLPQAPIVNDEGGPSRLVGSLDYTDFSIRFMMQNPAPALIDMVHIVQGDKTQFAPVESQILGLMTSPVFPPPLRYAFDLPAEPTATLLDVDNDGKADTGVQIFQLIVSANINGLSHLVQLDQATDTISYLTDPTTGNITKGNLLVYAPDDQQGFPSGFGDDGILFTADDPAMGLPQGYTVVHFGPDSFTFDRAAEATLDLLPNPEASSPDFSDQGIVESFNSLIDHLALRYSFTELRQLDWEAIRAQYLPQVEEAEQLFATNPTTGAGLYGHLLHLLAQDVRGAHVTAVFNDTAYMNEFMVADALNRQPILTNLGANTLELSDGRIVVADVLPGSPAAEAGWTFGTEIVAVNGIPVADQLPTVVYNETLGTDEGQRLARVNNLLKFPGANSTEPVAEVTIDAILPGATAAQTYTLTPGQYALPDRLASLVTRDMAIQYKLAPGYGYLTWGGFENPEADMAGLRQFLKEVKESPAPINGIVLDLRGNGGGWDLLYFTMASYFFSAEQPVSMHWIDMDAFDPNVSDLVREAPDEYLLSAPDAYLYYGGPLVVLVDQHCASSCEFFTQFLQTNDRATVVAQHASGGAGAPINRVAMPFGILFQYTKGRSYFAGTEELNLEGKGVVPDVRVPVTLESVAGGDPVLAAGVELLSDLGGQAFVASLVMTPTTAELTPGFTAIYPEGWSALTTGTQVSFTAPDQTSQISYDNPDAADLAAALASQMISDPAAAPLATHTANGVEWSIYVAPDQPPFAFRAAVAQIDGKWHVIKVAAAANIIEYAVEGLLYPAIDAYVPGAGI
jgi:C-terminal processing protease CtpA/Prc